MQFVTFVEADENDSSPMCTLVLTRKREEAGHSDARSTASEFQRLCPSHGAMWRTPRPYVHTDVHTHRECASVRCGAPRPAYYYQLNWYICVCVVELNILYCCVCSHTSQSRFNGIIGLPRCTRNLFFLHCLGIHIGSRPHIFIQFSLVLRSLLFSALQTASKNTY